MSDVAVVMACGALVALAGILYLWLRDRKRVKREREALAVVAKGVFPKWAGREISSEDYWAYLCPERGIELMGRDDYMDLLRRLGYSDDQAARLMAERERAL